MSIQRTEPAKKAIPKKFRLTCSIIDGLQEYGDILPRLYSSREEDLALKTLAEIYAWNENEKNEIFNVLKSEGRAEIDGGERMIKNVRFEEIPQIKIIVRGGLVQDIFNPEGVPIQVYDYDESIDRDEEGNPCGISEW